MLLNEDQFRSLILCSPPPSSSDWFDITYGWLFEKKSVNVILTLRFYPIMISGDLIISDRIDYEALENKQLTFDLAVYDAGVPQFR